VVIVGILLEEVLYPLLDVIIKNQNFLEQILIVEDVANGCLIPQQKKRGCINDKKIIYP
jgi:hypothetical protein